MKAIGTMSANLFGMTAAALFLMAGSAAAVEVSAQLQAAALQAIPDAVVNNNAIQHCGCDNNKGIEMYVQNLINDAKQRGLSCEASLHIPACISTYCSICKGHDGLVENCIKTGVEYFSSNSGFCSQEQKGVASYMPDMRFLSQFIN